MKRTNADNALEIDYYALLGIDINDFAFDEKVVGKAYRKASVLYHPDKIGKGNKKVTEDDKEVWLKIQTAYETLIDPSRKKKYDSTLPFDDTVPVASKMANDADFY